MCGNNCKYNYVLLLILLNLEIKGEKIAFETSL